MVLQKPHKLKFYEISICYKYKGLEGLTMDFKKKVEDIFEIAAQPTVDIVSVCF